MTPVTPPPPPDPSLYVNTLHKYVSSIKSVNYEINQYNKQVDVGANFMVDRFGGRKIGS